MRVIDDFLDDYYIDYLSSCVTSPMFEWRYHNNISKFIPPNHASLRDNKQLHGLSKVIFDIENNIRFESDGWIPATLKIEKELGIHEGGLTRARLDMTLQAPEKIIHTPHTDQNYPHWSVILYLIDSDGDTIIYNEKRRNVDHTELTIQQTVSPKKNRLVIFDGDYMHTGHSPVDHANRILLNLNFYK